MTRPCRKTSAHPCLLGAHLHTHHGRRWQAVDALSTGLRCLLAAAFTVAAVLGLWALVAMAVLGAAGDLP
jgi:hypothetical protein